jgi:ribonucleotide reductase beta subunit family protein with ferritin-like domain
MIEGVHEEVYSKLITTYVKDPVEQKRLFNVTESMPAVKQKAEWAENWITRATSLAESLVAFIAVEGIFFSGSFCAIFWVKKRGLMQGLTFSNELISRDEALHCLFAIHIYSLLQDKLPESRVREILLSACAVELEFVCESLPVDLIGMNKKMMSDYIKFVTDWVLDKLGYKKEFFVRNPFDWMDLICLEGKTNFFERRVAEYQLADVMSSLEPPKTASEKYLSDSCTF